MITKVLWVVARVLLGGYCYSMCLLGCSGWLLGSSGLLL